MEKTLSSLATRLNYIRNNTDNAFIKKQCDIIDIKLEDIREKKFKEKSTVNDICFKINMYNISSMKRVAGQTNMVYRKMDELAGYVDKIRTQYFESK